MHIPTPDRLLLDAIEALFSPPQRRGVPLPLAMVVTEFAPAVGAGMVCITTHGLASDPLVACWAVLALALGGYAFLESRRLVRDARAWNAALAQSYRSCAHAIREELVGLRMVFLLFMVGLAAIFVLFGFQRGPTDPATLNVAAYASLAGGFLAMFLGGCVIPRDREPDPVAHVGASGLRA